jgi:CheY-like chemotaxis protein
VRLPQASVPWDPPRGRDATATGSPTEREGSPPGTEAHVPSIPALLGDNPGTEPPIRPSDLSILVVDDEPAVRRTMGMVLGRLGYQVEEAGSPESALRRIEESPRSFDLLITDQAMPGMSGLELARRARKIRGDLPVLLASGYLDAEAQAGASALGITGVIQKPYDRAGLRALVRSALGQTAGTSGPEQGT